MEQLIKKVLLAPGLTGKEIRALAEFILETDYPSLV